MKVHRYQGWRDAQRNIVCAYAPHDKTPQEITPPEGEVFDWGYVGHAPHVTAKAILAHYCQANNRYYEPWDLHCFVVDRIARFDDMWILAAHELDNYTKPFLF
jgi:hypothetical protein